MKPPMFSSKRTCSMFKWAHEQLTHEYSKYAQRLREMHGKAVETGTKVNGYTAGQLKVMADRFEELAKV